MPCVGQTNSANEWQQQSGGMVSRRGSVLAAFLLCFLAQVRAFRRPRVTRFSTWVWCRGALNVRGHDNLK